MWTWPARACRSNRLACWSRLWFLGWRIWKECVDASTQKIRQITVGLLQISTFMILHVEIIWNQMRWTKRHASHILSSYSSFAQHIKSGSWDQRNWHDWAGHCGWHQDHALEKSTNPTLRSAVEKCFFGTKAWVHSHWQHRRGDASANGWRIVDGRRWYAGQCGHVETLSPWISQWAQLFCCLSFASQCSHDHQT